jgi:protoheme IX farnesyltransferase
MLPVVRGARTTALQVLAYAALLAAVTILPGVTGTFGAFYLGAAIVLGGVFCGFAWRLWRGVAAGKGVRQRASVLFHFSLLYLALLFVAVAVDAAIR